MTRHLSRLFEHLVWADERVLAGLRAGPHVDPRALELYGHVVGAEHVWLARLHERPARSEVWPRLSVAEAGALAAENAAGFRALIESATRDELARQIPYRNSAGASFRSTVEDMLLHVALHGAYHRGQIALLVRAAGGEPQPTDYIAFVRGAPAARRVSDPVGAPSTP